MTLKEREAFAISYNGATGHHGKEEALEIINNYLDNDCDEEACAGKYNGVSTVIDALIIWQGAITWREKQGWFAKIRHKLKK